MGCRELKVETMSRRRKGKKPEVKSKGEQSSPADLLRDALSEISEGKQAVDRRYPSKQRHVDEYRELLIRRAEAGEASEALMRLTEEAHRNRERLSPEQRRRVDIPETALDGGGAQQAAQEAAQQFRDRLRKRGGRERTHYYPATERQQTGEIDRTYRVPRPKAKRRGNRRSR